MESLISYYGQECDSVTLKNYGIGWKNRKYTWALSPTTVLVSTLDRDMHMFFETHVQECATALFTLALN